VEALFSAEGIANLGVLIFLQAVLGFDNLLYISIESQRAPKEVQTKVRRNGILIAVGLRIVLLFVIMQLLESLQSTFPVKLGGIFEAELGFASIVFLLGGAFIMYTAVKEIGHMLAIEDPEHDVQHDKGTKTAGQVVFMIVLMNLVFSFDSILSALAITKEFWVLATAIVITGVLMLVMADRVSDFIKKNRKYEVLGLFILLIVGVVLLGEGGHVAHMKLFGYEVEAMSKTTFYFSIAVLVIVDIAQGKYKKKLDLERKAQFDAPKAAASPEAG